MARELNDWEKAKLLGFDVPFVVSHPKDEPPKEEEITVVKVLPPEPATKWGQWTWWRCRRCKRYYDAPEELSVCVLCQFKALGGGLTRG